MATLETKMAVNHLERVAFMLDHGTDRAKPRRKARDGVYTSKRGLAYMAREAQKELDRNRLEAEYKASPRRWT